MWTSVQEVPDALHLQACLWVWDWAQKAVALPCSLDACSLGSAIAECPSNSVTLAMSQLRAELHNLLEDS